MSENPKNKMTPEKTALIANLIIPGTGFLLLKDIKKGLIVLIAYLLWLCAAIFLIISVIGCCIVIPVEVGIRIFIAKSLLFGQKCPLCGQKLENGVKFCNVCGKDTTSAEKQASGTCPKCGHKINSEDIFCQECGTNLIEEL